MTIFSLMSSGCNPRSRLVRVEHLCAIWNGKQGEPEGGGGEAREPTWLGKGGSEKQSGFLRLIQMTPHADWQRSPRWGSRSVL